MYKYLHVGKELQRGPDSLLKYHQCDSSNLLIAIEEVEVSSLKLEAKGLKFSAERMHLRKRYKRERGKVAGPATFLRWPLEIQRPRPGLIGF